MKKIVGIAFFLLFVSCFAKPTTSSTVLLSGGGDVLATTSINLSLNGLVPLATYSVICYITTSNPFQFVKFGNNFSSNASSISYYSLNGNTVVQAQLSVGKNIAVIVGNFANPTTDQIVFTNLDQTTSFNVNNCFAMPVQTL